MLVDNFGVVLEELLECAVPAGNGGKLARTTSLRFLGAPTTVGLRPLRQNLIAFDFTNFKFFQYLATEEHRRTIVSRWIVGMTMILIGLTGLALAWIQHRHQMKALRAEVGTMPYSISGIMAGLIAILGVIALIVVAMRL